MWRRLIPTHLAAGRPILGRLIPDGLASRLAATVVLALVLTQAVSAGLYLTDPGAPRPVHTPGEFRQRVNSIVQLVEGTPATDRPRVVRALDDPVLGVEWQQARPTDFPAARAGGGGGGIRHHLQGLMGNREFLLEVRRDPPPFPPPGGPLGLGPPPPGEGPPHHRIRSLRLAVALDDGSWLIFTASDAPDGALRLQRFLLWMGLVGVVIAGVSLLAAARLGAPLAAFARAAERLGVDGTSEPLPEAGPAELRAATRAVNRMQERLSAFVADRTRMLAAISHDLRTPLTRLRLRAELVEDEEQQRRMLADLDEMESMLNATLAFARDDAHREPRVATDIAQMLQSLCDDRADMGQTTTYLGPTHLACPCRPVALRRALANLIDNAIKYGQGAEIHLTADDHQVEITVEDRGPGIPDSALERVFQPFTRLDTSRSRDTGGTGLGLATARSILRGLGGDVVLTNRPQGGLKATARIPR